MSKRKVGSTSTKIVEIKAFAEGGIIAILKGARDLTAENLEFI